MDYLTKYYKNLSEQLQQKLNILEAQINEAMSEQEALGMPVPILKSGKRGNYEQWRAANDARNAALRDARMGGGREKIIGKLVRPEDLDKKPGTADTKFPSDIFKPDYVLPGREPRMPMPGDRGPIPFNPDRKPLFPGMNPNPYIKPGLKPVNPPKISSDLFKRPTGGLLPAPGTEPETKSASDRFIDYYLHKDPSDRFRVGKSPKTDHKRPMDYLGQESLIKNTGSLPKLGDSNLIGKIPTEQEAYGGRLMSKMQQSQNTPLEKDTIKNFIQSIRAGAKPGEKIKKTPSKILYRDEDEIPYIQ